MSASASRSGKARRASGGAIAASKTSPGDAGMVVISPPYPRWLLGSGCLQFQTSVRFGRGGTHQLAVELTVQEVLQAAASLSRDLAVEFTRFHDVIRRGKNQQTVPIDVSRETILGIARALEGFVDEDDAGHRFWHWQYPGSPVPCSSCQETLADEDASAEAARLSFLLRWSGTLGATTAQLEGMLSEYQGLPRPPDRRRFR